MTKSILLFGILALSVSVNAQLKVSSDGKVFINKTLNPDSNSYLNVSNLSSNIITYYNYCRAGIHSIIYNTTPSVDCVGVYGEGKKITLNNNSDDDFAIGVFGYGFGATGAHNIGVLGTIHPCENGCAIYGTSEGNPNTGLSGRYAGYFDGEAYVNGSLTTVGLYNLSDIRLKSNVVSLSQASGNQKNVLDDLQKLEVFEYTLKRPMQNSNKKMAYFTDREVSERMALLDNRRHYGVSAQELQEMYPDLVSEGQDGYLTVNYVEMVPLLLRSIQELKQQIDELRGKNSGSVSQSRMSSFYDEEDDHVETGTPRIIEGAALFQSTPNPFTERTTIRFSLSENVRSAYIYIFDMSGKMIRQVPVDASMQSITVNGYELSPGIYLYSLVVDGQEVDTKKMILSD